MWCNSGGGGCPGVAIGRKKQLFNVKILLMYWLTTIFDKFVINVCVCVRDRDRDRDRETKRPRERDRETERQKVNP